VFVVCPNCFGHVAVDRHVLAARHRCKDCEPVEVYIYIYRVKRVKG